MARLRYNGLSATLGAALTSSATAVTFGAALTHAAGSVPTIASPDYLPLTILDSSGNVSEIVSLTAYTSGATTGTISRAQEGTTGVAHSSGDRVINGATALDVGSTKNIDLPLSSITDWTVIAGTWAISSGVLRQSDTTASARRIKLNTKVPFANIIVEVDVKIDVSTSAASGRAGINFGGGADWPIVSLLTQGTTANMTAVDFERDGTTNYGYTPLPGGSVPVGTWMTLRAQLVGPYLTAWINGALVDSCVYGTPFARGVLVGLYTYATDASFRNLKVWNPIQP